MSRSWVFGALFLLVAAAGVSAERAWVAHRAGASVTLFDTTAALPPGALATVTVGSGPVDIASDQPDAEGPLKLFVANSGSQTVTVIDTLHNTAVATITGGGTFGTLATPSGVARVAASNISPTIAVTDQKVTDYYATGTGRGTIRFVSPVSYQVEDDFRDASPTARYNDVIWTPNRRLWIADDGDAGVVVVRLDTVSGPPFYLNKTLVYQGTGEFADFIRDTAATPSFLLAPRRLATNGTSRVVVADGGSDKVTVLDMNYVPTNALGEPGAILQTVALTPALAGDICGDVEVSGNFAYVSTSGTAASGANLHRVDLTTFAVTSIVVGAGATGIEGLGATQDGSKLYVGENSLGSTITEIDIQPAGVDFAVIPPAFTFGATYPFAFYSSIVNANPPSTTTGAPGWGPGVDLHHHSSCGLLGLEVLLLVAFLRRRPRLS